MNQRIQELAAAWWKRTQACIAIEARIADDQDKLSRARGCRMDLEKKICTEATVGTKVITVEPGVCIVLQWDADNQTHELTLVKDSDTAELPKPREK